MGGSSAPRRRGIELGQTRRETVLLAVVEHDLDLDEYEARRSKEVTANRCTIFRKHGEELCRLQQTGTGRDVGSKSGSGSFEQQEGA